MEIARDVAKDLVKDNPKLRWGVFSFDPQATTTSGILRAEIQDPTKKHLETVKAAIEGLAPDTWTPLGETMFEMTRYFAGESSYYKKTNTNYTSPIQYRCQKNFAIVMTDGESTKDNLLPGLGIQVGINYQSGLDGSNKPINKEFKVCTATSTISSVSCPAILEESSSNNPFTAQDGEGKTGYVRSLRDVAMYANDRDFKLEADGVDKDGVSWDDPNFPKQSVTTYTVGFDLQGDAAKAANAVLKATAKVGKGAYYAADNKEQLKSSLQNVVDSIVASTSNAGGLAAKSVDSFKDNLIFQPVFNPNGWYGELRCRTLTADGKLDEPCKPREKAFIPVPTEKNKNGRVVFSYSSMGAFNFDENNMRYLTETEKKLFGATTAEQEKTIKYVRGIDMPGMRSRKNSSSTSPVLLGDIVDGVPLVVARPEGYSPDKDFAKFTTDNADRGMVMVGANDGMLHAFRIKESSPSAGDNMTELMAYIPSPVYPRLKALGDLTYGQTGGTPHAYHVNGNMQKETVKLGVTANGGGTWTTVVVGGLGQGGQGIFAIDATSVKNFSDPTSTIKWEWTDVNDSDMGHVMGTPVIYNVRTAGAANGVTPAVIVANGYENDWDDGNSVKTRSSALFILDAATGQLIKKISVPDTANSTGLSTAAGFDVGTDGVLDYVYAGDVNGRLWRFDLTSNTPAGFKVASKPIFDAGSNKPITQRPAVMRARGGAKNDVNLGLMVYFGTGQLLKNEDRLDDSTQSFYGVLDKLDAEPTTVKLSDLQEQTVEDELYVAPGTSGKLTGTYRKVSDNDLDLFASSNSKKGWYINLPNTSERLVTTVVALVDRVLFGTGVPKSDKLCTPGGKGWIMGLNPFTGSVVRKNNKASEAAGKAFSFIDLTGDKRSSVDDKLAFKTPAYISAYQTPGIPTDITVLSNEQSYTEGDPNADQTQELGRIVALRSMNQMGVFRDTVNTKLKAPKEDKPGCPTLNGTIGNDGIQVVCHTGAGGEAARLVKSTWREIK